MHLEDYKVRVVNARAETAARVRVVIEWQDANSVRGTVEANENVIEASWMALAAAFAHKRFRMRRTFRNHAGRLCARPATEGNATTAGCR
jgi:2-isopropylmalate synthase